MPKHKITVSGKDITFLIDSGATESVIKCEEFVTTPKMSVGYLKTIGATGTTVYHCLDMMRLKGILNIHFCCHHAAS